MTIVTLTSDTKHLSKDLLDKCKNQCLVVQLFGIKYYIPVTKPIKKIIKTFCPDGRDPGNKVEDLFRDIVAALYLQVRDTIGSEVYSELETEMKDAFVSMFSKKLEAKVEQRLEDKTEINLSIGGPDGKTA